MPVRGSVRAYPVRAHLISSYRVASLIPYIEALSSSVSKFTPSECLNHYLPHFLRSSSLPRFSLLFNLFLPYNKSITVSRVHNSVENKLGHARKDFCRISDLVNFCSIHKIGHFWLFCLTIQPLQNVHNWPFFTLLKIVSFYYQ